jgi:ankyrin repeat protein
MYKYRAQHSQEVSHMGDPDWRQLKDALKTDDIKETHQLLKKGLPAIETINEKDSVGWMLLHEACLRGNMKLAELFINRGADVNAQTRNGATPLHHAVYHGHMEMVKYLMAKGADANIANNDGETPLQWAEMMEHGEIATYLRSLGAE